MMFALRIVAFADLEEGVPLFAPSHIISMMDTALTLPGEHAHLRVAVDDVTVPIEGYIHPVQAHLDQVLAFTADLTAMDRLLVHCFAGISRSTAAAIAVLIQHGIDYAEAFKMVAAERPMLLPNRALIRLTDRHFGLDGALEAHVKRFYRQQTLAWRAAYRLHGTSWRAHIGR